MVSLAACTKQVTQTVNQAFSAIYTLNPNGWTSSDGGLSFSTNLRVPELDQIIQDHGGVIVYLSFNNGSTYEAIPEVFNGIAYGVLHSTGNVTIDLFGINGGTITAPGGTILAKVVLIDARALGP
ncbi:MAG: hypothetical protein C5B59_13035 [Bacteroidetes bacterium]|nr:MAG: hypothetical protein C5B59_13035 [Bacteroidota bacterium]